jgi:hypothetical protein
VFVVAVCLYVLAAISLTVFLALWRGDNRGRRRILWVVAPALAAVAFGLFFASLFTYFVPLALIALTGWPVIVTRGHPARLGSPEHPPATGPALAAGYVFLIALMCAPLLALVIDS